MDAASPLGDATLRLQKALERLEDAVDARLSRDHVVLSVEEEVQRMTADRSRLAGELDTALTRAQRLETANREVSRRLVNAMESIRDVLADRRS
ncbi:DUF4164 family protein [Aureimonas flava]|uniref:DUF4164 family protein n=1 Tax=Aureimonas flava TaxID=2320271 RepID=A0A3A1WFV7_9HYPH|nr:DUF4164 domain-containing protein [Aureimonas flava]RIX98855.1 DUF4164 family protein [Aureimonas flava]